MTHLRKPLKRTTRTIVPYGVNPMIVVTLYPEGTIGLREARHRQEYRLGLGSLYVQAVAAETRRLKAERKHRKKETKPFYARKDAFKLAEEVS